MSMLCAQQRARRRRIEAGLLAGVVLALTAAGALLVAARLATTFEAAQATFRSIG